MNDIIQPLWPWSAFMVSLAIGLMIGLERERSPAAKAGLRTFSLVALAGTIGALLADKTGSPWLLAAGLLILGGMMVSSYYRMPEEGDPGTTTIAAIVVCYGLGAMVWYGYVELAVSIGILSTVLLYFKTELRGVSQRLTRTDLVSILQFAVLSLVILPLLPDRSFDHYGVLNPTQIWWMVVLISGISLAGYAALRIAGERKGALLTGLLGGAISSTATTLTFARNCRGNPGLAGIATVIILLANWMVLFRLSIVIAIVMPAMLPRLAPILAGGAAAGVVGILVIWRRLAEKPQPPSLKVQNPAEIRTALTFGALYALVLFASAWLSDLAGNHGLYGVAVVSGLTDVDAITLSSLRLFGLGNILAEQAETVILLALLANIAFKTLLAGILSGGTLARPVALGMALCSAGLLATWLLS